MRRITHHLKNIRLPITHHLKEYPLDLISALDNDIFLLGVRCCGFGGKKFDPP
jgi:hypothetical protein